MKRPCAREFGIIKFIIAENNKFVEIRREYRANKQNIKECLAVHTVSDIEKMIKWLEKAKQWIEEKR